MQFGMEAYRSLGKLGSFSDPQQPPPCLEGKEASY